MFFNERKDSSVLSKDFSILQVHEIKLLRKSVCAVTRSVFRMVNATFKRSVIDSVMSK